MFQARYSKLKQVFVSVLLPRLLLKDTKFYNRAVVVFEQLSRARKSTDKGSYEDEQMRIIEKCFGKPIQEHNIKDIQNSNETDKCSKIENPNIVTPEFYNTRCEQHATTISKLFGNKPKYNLKTSSKSENRILDDAKLQATTYKLEEEKLTQKIEVIEETPHVEAHAPKVEGLNLPPKVLGNESFILELSRKNKETEQFNLDELAMRCLGSPIKDIDDILLQELRNNKQQRSQSKVDGWDLVSNQCTEHFFYDDTYKKKSPVLDQHTMNTEYKFHKMQPLHLDATPLIKVDEEIKEFKDNTMIREFSTIYFATDVNETVSDTPESLSPYEKPAIPFYEYINKETMAPEDDSNIQRPAITEEIQETEIIFQDETLHRDSIDHGQSQGMEIETEQPLNPKPNVSHFSKPFRTPSSPEVNESLYQNLTQGYFLNVFTFQRFFTSSSDQPSGWFPDDTSQKGEQRSTAISATITPEGDSKTLEIPSNTAISANQNPDEYYKMSFPDEFIIENQTNTFERIFAESPVTQNMIFSAIPQQLELEETAIKNNPKLRKDPISKLILESENKEDNKISKAIQPNFEELSSKNNYISNTESIPLSLLLKRIREQNRLEYCRDLISKVDVKLEETKKFSCPPVKKYISKTSKKPKQACDKIQPCQRPTKKDPCTKFTPLFLTVIKCDFPIEAFKKPSGESLTYLAIITGDVIKRLNTLGQKLRYFSKGINEKSEITYARDFDPWIPIPSWPIPKKENTRPFVCPKEGCKIAVPKSTKQTNKSKQCLEVPKKNYFMNQVLSLFYF